MLGPSSPEPVRPVGTSRTSGTWITRAESAEQIHRRAARDRADGERASGGTATDGSDAAPAGASDPNAPREPDHENVITARHVDVIV